MWPSVVLFNVRTLVQAWKVVVKVSQKAFDKLELHCVDHCCNLNL